MTVRRGWIRLAAAVAACWLIAGVPFEAAKIEVKAARDETFSFAGLKTWAWPPEGPGEVKVAFASNTDPAPINANLRPVILSSVERELAKRKLTKTDATPDLILRFYMLVTASTFTQSMGEFLPATTGWGLPPFTPQTTAFEVLPVGTFVLDASVPGRDAIVWRGAAQAKVSLDQTPQERAKVLDQAITQLLRKFPTK